MAPETKGLHLSPPGYDLPLSKASLALRVAGPKTASLVEGERLPVASLSDAWRAKGLAFGAAEKSAGEMLLSPWRDGGPGDAIVIRRTTSKCPRHLPPSPEAGLATSTET
ncbi:MAG: hypothetical protein M3272_04065 [Actinomycetota bacterium]|nr:hypothetical protein [Actinomycetota bacterium]